MILDDDFESKVEAELARAAEWSREALESEITRLRQLLSEADQRVKEAREKVLEDLAEWIEGQRKDVPAHGWEFAAAIRERAMQSEER